MKKYNIMFLVFLALGVIGCSMSSKLVLADYQAELGCNSPFQLNDNFCILYNIKTASDLLEIANLVKNGDTFEGKTIRLLNDIDMSWVVGLIGAIGTKGVL